MNRLISLIVFACVGLCGCAGPVKAQPTDIVAERMKRVEDAILRSEATIAMLTTEVQDHKLDLLIQAISDQNDLLVAAMATQSGLQAEIKESRRVTNGQAMIGTGGGLVALLGIGGAYKAGGRRSDGDTSEQ